MSREKELEHTLNLLAVIHCDGGDYTAEHGVRKSVDDALKIVCQFKNARACQPTGTELAVCEDITRRQQMGVKKYGQTVAENPLPLSRWLQHAYEEALDLAIYLKRAQQEMIKKPVENQPAACPECSIIGKAACPEHGA